MSLTRQKEGKSRLFVISVPGKALNRVILHQLWAAVDSQLRDNQAGFRQNKSCADQKETLCIIEQTKAFKSPLRLRWFWGAFDSLERETLCHLIKHYGIPDKFINIFRNTYTGMQSCIIHEGKLTQPFDIVTWVRQGCLLSPLLFPIAVDHEPSHHK